MTNKKDQEGEYQALLHDAEFSKAEQLDAASVLDRIYSEPQISISPPPGYESKLMAALKTKIPELSESPKAAPAARPARAPSRSWFASNQFAWLASGTLALVAILASTNLQSLMGTESAPGAGSDLVAQTVQRGDGQAATAWLESVGDAGVRSRVARNDFSSIATKVRSEDDQKKLNAVLDDVARSLGMK